MTALCASRLRAMSTIGQGTDQYVSWPRSKPLPSVGDVEGSARATWSECELSATSRYENVITAPHSAEANQPRLRETATTWTLQFADGSVMRRFADLNDMIDLAGSI